MFYLRNKECVYRNKKGNCKFTTNERVKNCPWGN